MKKVLNLVAIIAILLLVLTGCVQVNYEVTLNENGSADVSFIYGFEKEALEQLGTTADDMTKDMEESSNEDGYTIEKYEDEEIAGFKANKHFDDAAEISLVEVFGEENVTESEGGRIKIENNGSSTVFSQNAEIDLSKMDETTASMMAVKYTIKLPVKATSNNATTVSEDGKSLTWELKAGELNKIEFEATKGSNGLLDLANGKGLNLVLICGIALVVIIVVVVVIALVKKGKTSKEEKAEETNKDNE